MKILYSNKNKTGFRQINLYSKDSEKQIDTKTALFMNVKIPAEINRRSFITFIRSVIQRAELHKLEKISFNFNQVKNLLEIDEYDCAELFIKNIVLAGYHFDTYKSKKDSVLEEALIYGTFSRVEKSAFKNGTLVGKNINTTRDLANTPANLMTPTILANQVKKIFKSAPKTKVKILEEKDLKKNKMNLVLAVGQGSAEKSKFIIIEYMNGPKNQKPTVIIGKGITFDTGGVDVKPAGKFIDMYMDMTGAAVSVGTIKSIIDLKIKKNIVVLIPAVENAISGSAYRPGDIITSMSGKTVAIGHTDAEGRLVMADTITYAECYKPETIIDIATLTGASLVAVGQRASVIMSKNNTIQSDMISTGESVGDYLWPLPTWNEFSEHLKSDYADICNISNVRYGGTITAGMFLYEFVKMHKNEPNWIHLDIAPRMESIKSDNLAKGATGEPIAMLVKYLGK
ncbi:MAG: leucyl aminopeptidase family protein [Minisyncoccia bacterium]